MKATLKLNDPEIRTIIANTFGVSVDDVSVGTEIKMMGHGPFEYEMHTAVATVTVPWINGIYAGLGLDEPIKELNITLEPQERQTNAKVPDFLTKKMNMKEDTK